MPFKRITPRLLNLQLVGFYPIEVATFLQLVATENLHAVPFFLLGGGGGVGTPDKS